MTQLMHKILLARKVHLENIPLLLCNIFKPKTAKTGQFRVFVVPSDIASGLNRTLDICNVRRLSETDSILKELVRDSKHDICVVGGWR